MPDEPEAIKADNAEARQDNISAIYYYYRDLLAVGTDEGRTAGRKIGVVQEIIVRKILEACPILRERMLFERLLPGFSGATHKVEFLFYALLQRLRIGQSLVRDGIEVQYVDFAADTAKLRWRAVGTSKWRGCTLKPRAVVGKALGTALRERSVGLLMPAGQTTISVLDLNDILASVESKRVGAQIFKDSTKLGSGIQTIEKAKQTSLVAIDADLKANRVVRPITLRDGVDPEARRYISVVVLGNGVHWTANDHNILKTFVDHTYLVRDEVMIRYGDYVQELAKKAGAGVPKFFMSYFDGMTRAKPDDFAVSREDLITIEPAEDLRPLARVLEEHMERHNHVP